MFCIIPYRCYRGCYSRSANRAFYHTHIDAIEATNPLSFNAFYRSFIDAIKATNPLSSKVLYHPSIYGKTAILFPPVLYHPAINGIKATHPPSSNVLYHPSIDAFKAAILCQSEFCIITRSMISKLNNVSLIAY